jgi:hypothetical protein
MSAAAQQAKAARAMRAFGEIATSNAIARIAISAEIAPPRERASSNAAAIGTAKARASMNALPRRPPSFQPRAISASAAHKPSPAYVA